MSFEEFTASTGAGPTQPGGPTPAAGPPPWRNKTWREAAGQPETAARLQQLPAGLTFPGDFPEPIAYDPSRQLLLYRGFMCHGSYQFLRQLSPDPAYLIALDRVYQASSSGLARRRRWPVRAACALVLLAVLAVLWWWSQ
jgi:hypothetical protein